MKQQWSNLHNNDRKYAAIQIKRFIKIEIGQNKIEQNRIKQNRIEQNRIEQNRIEQNRIEQNRIEQVWAWA